MTPRRVAVALCFGALALLPGCGSSNKGSPIPANIADRLNKNIAAADNYNSQGRCDRAHTKVRDARFVLTQMPSSVDANVRQGIGDGLAHLDSLISSECQRQTSTNTQTQTTQSNTTPTQTTQTQTTQTQTTQTQTTQTQTTPTGTNTTPTSTTPTNTGTGTTTGNGGTPTGTGATGTGTTGGGTG